MDHIEIKHDCPSIHPELGNKVSVLDIAMWVEEVTVFAPGMERHKLHKNCSEGVGQCLPIGKQVIGSRLEVEQVPARRMAQQIQLEFYSKPMAPAKVILASSAQPWGEK